MNSNESPQSNVTAVDLDIKLFHLILQYNYVPAFILGAVFNLLLIYLIIRRSPISLRPYCPILLIAAFTDAFAILMFGSCQMDMRIINDVGLFVLRGPAKQLPEVGQLIALSLLLISLHLEVFVLLLETSFRYQLLKKRSAMTLKQLLCCVLIIVFVCSLPIPVFISDYVYHRNVNAEYRLWWIQEDHNSHIMLLHHKISWVYQLFGIVWSTMSLSAFFFSICIAIWSVRVMKNEVSNMSKKTKDLLNQFTYTIIIRLIFFGITNVVPVVSNQTARYFGINGTNFNLISLVLYTYLPIINPIFCIGFIKPYRQVLFRALRLGPRLFSNQPQTFVTRVHSVS